MQASPLLSGKYLQLHCKVLKWRAELRLAGQEFAGKPQWYIGSQWWSFTPYRIGPLIFSYPFIYASHSHRGLLLEGLGVCVLQLNSYSLTIEALKWNFHEYHGYGYADKQIEMQMPRLAGCLAGWMVCGWFWFWFRFRSHTDSDDFQAAAAIVAKTVWLCGSRPVCWYRPSTLGLLRSGGEGACVYIAVGCWCYFFLFGGRVVVLRGTRDLKHRAYQNNQIFDWVQLVRLCLHIVDDDDDREIDSIHIHCPEFRFLFFSFHIPVFNFQFSVFVSNHVVDIDNDIDGIELAWVTMLPGPGYRASSPQLQLDHNLECDLECECIRLLFARIFDFEYIRAAWCLSIRWNRAQFDGIGYWIHWILESSQAPISRCTTMILTLSRHLKICLHTVFFM